MSLALQHSPTAHQYAPSQDFFTTDAEKFEAIAARNKLADGVFFYAVRTTGVYCKPSCGARLPKCENIVFYESGAVAKAAGFRPCRRCWPDRVLINGAHAAVLEACAMIKLAVQNDTRLPSLAQLAKRAGYSPFHFHRLFVQHAGLTPHQFGLARRAEFLKEQTMKQKKPPAKKAPQNISYAMRETSLGLLIVGATQKGVCALHFAENVEEGLDNLAKRYPHAQLTPDKGALAETFDTIIAFIDAPKRPLDLPLDIAGTVFQQKVWRALRAIKPGQTATYGEIAMAIGAPKAVRAVGTACGANPVSLVIPCHRILGKDGSLTGYRWGVDRKRILLMREKNTKTVELKKETVADRVL